MTGRMGGKTALMIDTDRQRDKQTNKGPGGQTNRQMDALKRDKQKDEWKGKGSNIEIDTDKQKGQTDGKLIGRTNGQTSRKMLIDDRWTKGHINEGKE